MAIFEKNDQNKVTVDDTDTLICFVENARNIDRHTEYIMRIQRGSLKDNQWHVSHRYSDFSRLHGELQQSNIELLFPPKKFIGNMQPSFIADRQKALQKYMDSVMKIPILSLSMPVRSFLDSNNYSKTIKEQALQTVSIALRGQGQFDLKGPLNNIGWRIRKHYFLVTESENKTNCILSWQNYGPDKYLEQNDMQAAFKSIRNISHPNIVQCLAVHNLENGAYVVRKLHESGSVRDILYATQYNNTFLSKYGNPKTRNTLTNGEIANYGMQILQTLQFLNEKDIPHGHLHVGNLFIKDHRILLSDIENGIMGVPSLYRSFITEHKKINNMEAVDVYCFGHTLYEMAFGAPLQQSTCDVFPQGISDHLESILRYCLSSASCKHGLPSISTLLLHPFFDIHPIANGTTVHLKFSVPIRDQLKKARAVIEQRLRKDQSLLRNVKREARIQQILNSDEELKKHKRRMKKRDSTWKSSSSLAETVRSHSISTTSSPTPPHMPDTSGNSMSTAMSVSMSPASPPDGRSALLSAICGFDKSKLARVNSH